MGKNHPHDEQRTTPANDTQIMGDRRNMPKGADKRSGKARSPK